MSLTCFNSSTISCKFPITSVRLSCKVFKDIRIQYSRFLFLKIRRFSEIFHDEKLSEVFLSDYLPIFVTSIFCSVRMRKSLYSEKRALFQAFLYQSRKKTTWLMADDAHVMWRVLNKDKVCGYKDKIDKCYNAWSKRKAANLRDKL